MTTAAIHARALALDDNAPDNVCPGCGQTITGWENYEAHYPPGVTPHITTHQRDVLRTIPLPWTIITTQATFSPVCPWTGDYLAARAHRRRLIAEGVTP